MPRPSATSADPPVRFGDDELQPTVATFIPTNNDEKHWHVLLPGQQDGQDVSKSTRGEELCRFVLPAIFLLALPADRRPRRLTPHWWPITRSRSAAAGNLLHRLPRQRLARSRSAAGVTADQLDWTAQHEQWRHVQEKDPHR